MAQDIFGNNIINTGWTVPQQVQQQTQDVPEQKKSGGIGGYLLNAGKGIYNTVSKTVDRLATVENRGAINKAADIYDKNLDAIDKNTSLTPEQKSKASDIVLKAKSDLLQGKLKSAGFDQNTSNATMFRKTAGDLVQTGLLAVAPGTGILKNAALGAAYGGASALTQDKTSAEDVLEGIVKGGVVGGGVGIGSGILSKLTGAADKVGNNLEKGVINPKVAPSVFGAAQEDAVTNAAKEVPGLSAKGKYANLGDQMNKLTGQISEELGKVTDTIPKDEFIARLRAESLDNADYLDSTNPQHLSTLESQLKRFTKNLPEDLTAKDVFQVKKDLGSAIGKGFDKLSTGEATNSLKQAQYDLWTQMDKRITEMAPAVKDLTTEQSNLIKSASGLKASANKTLGVPLLGLKSQTAEQGVQALKTIAGKGLDAASNVAAPLVSGNTGGLLNKALTTVGATQQPAQPQQAAQDTTATDSLDSFAPSTTPAGRSGPIFNSDVIQKLILEDLAQNGGKNVSTLVSLYNTFGKAAEPTAAQQTATGQINDAASLLDDMQQQLEQAGGGKGRIGGVLANIEGKVGLNNDVSAYNQTKTDAAIALAKALSGSTRLPPPSTLKLLEDSMPKFTDNPEEAAKKVADIKLRLQSRQANLQTTQ